MKKLRNFIIFLLILAIGICIINDQTDFFLNFGSYFPIVEEKYPKVSGLISDGSERLAELTDYIPSPSEIIAMIKHEEPPIDPSDVATNAYIENSPMLTFYPQENIGMVVDYDTVNIFGVVASKSKSHLIAEFSDENGESLEQVSMAADSDGKFNKKIDIPDTDSLSLRLAVYTGSKAYGQFESWVYNYITLDKTPDGGWEMSQSPVFSHNKQMYEKEHPGRKVYVYDTLSTGPEMVLLIEKIREMILAGASAEEIDRAAHNYMHHTHLLFSLASIDNLAKNGRMNRVVAKGISLLGIRVVGTANEVGALEMLDKCRGDQRAIICMIEHMKKRGYSGGRVIIAHNGNQPAAEALRKQIKKAFGAVRCDIHPTRGLCSYYAEPQSLLLGFES